MNNEDLPKCDCGIAVGLSAHDDRWWCPACLWKEIEELRKLLAPFASMGIPDNWPEQCHVRIDCEIGEDNWYEWLSYWGDDIARPTLPTIGHFRRIAAALKPKGGGP